jgi:hypothetical protein
VPLAVGEAALGAVLDERGRAGEHERVVQIDLRTQQAEEVSSTTRVYLHVPKTGTARVVGVRRL